MHEKITYNRASHWKSNLIGYEKLIKIDFIIIRFMKERKARNHQIQIEVSGNITTK